MVHGFAWVKRLSPGLGRSARWRAGQGLVQSIAQQTK